MPTFEQSDNAPPGHKKFVEIWLDGDLNVYALVAPQLPEGCGKLIGDMAMNVFARAFGHLEEVFE